MLPDYPDVKGRLRAALRQFTELAVKRHLGFVGTIREFQVHEGKDSIIHREDGSYQRVTPITVEAAFTIDRETITQATLDDILAILDKNAADIAEQRAKHFYSELDRITEETGNVIRGKALTPELYLELLEKVELEFNEAGKAILPTPIVSPKDAGHAQAAFDSLNNDPELRKQLEALVQKKREEWDASEADRELAG